MRAMFSPAPATHLAMSRNHLTVGIIPASLPGWLLLLWWLPIGAGFGDSLALRTDHLNTTLIAERTALVPGEPLRLGLLLEHDPDWHTYWLNPGDSGLATRIELELPPGFTEGPIQWPVPERLPVGPLVNFGYSGTLVLPLAIEPPRQFAEASVTLRARAEWLICKVECLPGSGEYTLTLPVANSAELDPHWAAGFNAADRRQPQPVATSAALKLTEHAVELHLPSAVTIAPDSDWTVFPLTPQVVANHTRPEWTETATGPVLRLPKSEYFVGTPKRFEFLLVRGDLAQHWTATTLTTGISERPTLGFATVLAFALLGGLILNLMPCVFPILFLKASGAIAAAGDRALLRRHGLFYTGGVIVSFLVIAALLLALRASGEALGWGFQLQSPTFIAALVLLFFALAMNFVGLFEIAGGFTGWGQSLTSGHGDRAAFFTGVLACLVASPCTAPFMGVALGVALTLPPAAALTVFAALGFGLALPVLVLGWVPGLARRLPRPGAWMDTVRRALAFPLLLTVVWLLWVYGEQTSVLALSWLLAALVGVAFALWLLGLRGRARALGWATLALCVALPLLHVPPVTPVAGTGRSTEYEAWSPTHLAELRAAGHPVLVNMTAAWCITCLANERVALSTAAVQGALRERGVRYLKGDWTRRDAEITAYLASFGRSGVPLYVLYPGPDRAPIVLPQLLTVAIVQQALNDL